MKTFRKVLAFAVKDENSVENIYYKNNGVIWRITTCEGGSEVNSDVIEEFQKMEKRGV